MNRTAFGLGAAALIAVALATSSASGGAASAAETSKASTTVGCGQAVTFGTEIQFGGNTAPWHTDADLTVLINNRRTIIDGDTVPAGTQLTWTGPNGNANITVGPNGTFTGSAQFPGEGGVGYRGTL